MTDKPNERSLPARFLVLTVLVLATFAYRFLVYGTPQDSALWPYLFSAPFLAAGLFSGAKFTQRWAALLVPLAAMAVSDLVLHRMNWAPILTPMDWLNQVVTYSLLTLMILLGIWLQPRQTVATIAGGTLAGALLFFVVSNGIYWLTSPAGLAPPIGYPKTFLGLIECYGWGLPFLRNSLIGNGIGAVALFGGFALLERLVPALQPRKAELAPAC